MEGENGGIQAAFDLCSFCVLCEHLGVSTVSVTACNQIIFSPCFLNITWGVTAYLTHPPLSPAVEVLQKVLPFQMN